MNDANPDEYCVLENRQPQRWDDYLGRICIGLQVTHVDFLAGPWNQNRVNTDPYHQRMTIIASNNCYKGANSATSSAEYLACLQGNFFPGSTAADTLTDETLPAMAVYSGGFMGKQIYDICENADDTVTLNFCPRGVLSTVDGLSADSISSHSFTACWNAVEHAQAYRIRLFPNVQLVSVADSIRMYSYTFTGLHSNLLYTFSVQPLADDFRNGPWSDSLPVSLLADAVQTLPSETVSFDVADAAGRSLGRHSTQTVSRIFGRGVYILKGQDGVSSKFFVK